MQTAVERQEETYYLQISLKPVSKLLIENIYFSGPSQKFSGVCKFKTDFDREFHKFNITIQYEYWMQSHSCYIALTF